MRRVLTAAAASVLLAAPTVAGAATIHVDFRGYANNVRVRAPLVGPWQLGVARIRGSADLGSTADGTIRVTNNPKFSRYPDTAYTASVIGYRFRQAAHNGPVKIRLDVEIVRTNALKCAAGDRGTIKLRDSAEKLDNGENQDYIVVDWAGDRCPGFVQGWTNDDGGERTSPQFGGPPHGGQWAIVDAG